MDISKVKLGNNAPYEVNVIIEIPLGGSPVKYEIDKCSGAMVVDRFLHTAMYYPANYGFIPHTLSEDGDPVDAIVLGREPVIPGCVIKSRPVGVLIMEDESGIDEKILMVPVDDLHPYYSRIKTHEDLPDIMRDQIKHFFEHYKDLENNKWVKVKRWGSHQEAIDYIKNGISKGKQTSS